MAKAKKNHKEDILNAYSKFILENGETPKSMSQFAKILGIKEVELYNSFASFNAMDQAIFSLFFDQAITLLEKDPEYKKYDAKNKLLSLYFTFFEILKANRSFVLFSLDKGKLLESMRNLALLKKQFKNYIDLLDIKSIDLRRLKLEKMKKETFGEIAWTQLLMTLKFWIKDTSSGFEKTDIFIEKSLNASFDIISTEPLESVIDLGKFLFKERMSMSN